MCRGSCRRTRLASGPGETPSSFNGNASNICADYMDRGVGGCSAGPLDFSFIAELNGRPRSCGRKCGNTEVPCMISVFKESYE